MLALWLLSYKCSCTLPLIPLKCCGRSPPCSLALAALPPISPPPQLNLVVVLDGAQPKLLPRFDVGPLKLGWSINVDGKYVFGFLA